MKNALNCETQPAYKTLKELNDEVIRTLGIEWEKENKEADKKFHILEKTPAFVEKALVLVTQKI